MRRHSNSAFPCKTLVYEYPQKILTLQTGRCFLVGAIDTNQTADGNETARFLQDESKCNDVFSSYVESAIENEIQSILPVPIETLDVEVGNVTREFDAGLVLLFDVKVAIRSALNEHFLNRYVAGPFDSTKEQDDFIFYLKGSGCPEYSNLTDVRFVLPPQPNFVQSDDRSTAESGLIAGLVAAVSAAAILVGVFLFARHRRDSSPRAMEEQVTEDAVPSREGVDVVSEVGIRTAQDVSTLGDPLPRGASHAGGDASTADSVSLDYDYQKAYMQADPSTVSGSRSGDGESLSQLLVDDDTLDAQYQTDQRVEVDAPAGVLGLVLETNVDGIPVVHAIKPNSVLAGNVLIGDRLLSVDGHDVSVMLASDVSKLIASKKDQSVRKFVFSRPGR